MLQSQKVTRFQFVDGKIVNSFKKRYLTNKNKEYQMINANNIPLLFSKLSLKKKKAGIVLNSKHDKAVMFGKLVELLFSSNGPNCINIVHKECSMDDSESNRLVNKMNEREKTQVFTRHSVWTCLYSWNSCRDLQVPTI